MRHNLKAAIESVFGSQVACAPEVRIHPVRLNRICNGWVDPTPEERKRLVGALNADPVWLFSSVVKIPAPPTAPFESAPALACAGREG